MLARLRAPVTPPGSAVMPRFEFPLPTLCGQSLASGLRALLPNASVLKTRPYVSNQTPAAMISVKGTKALSGRR